jgi:hypothetical protein
MAVAYAISRPEDFVATKEEGGYSLT